MPKPPAPTLSEAAAAAVAVSVVLPQTFLGRDVFLGAKREGRHWRLCAIDKVGNRYPIRFGGVPDETLYLSRRQAFEVLNTKGFKVGAKVWATPEKRPL